MIQVPLLVESPKYPFPELLRWRRGWSQTVDVSGALAFGHALTAGASWKKQEDGEASDSKTASAPTLEPQRKCSPFCSQYSN